MYKCKKCKAKMTLRDYALNRHVCDACFKKWENHVNRVFANVLAKIGNNIVEANNTK